MVPDEWDDNWKQTLQRLKVRKKEEKKGPNCSDEDNRTARAAARL
jgi:hypothetical protein